MRVFTPLIIIVLLLSGCNSSPQGRKVLSFKGSTMGTTYLVKVVTDKTSPDSKAMQKSIEDSLELVNDRLSNWRPKSEISNFNNSQNTQPVPISSDFAVVMKESFRIHELSEGRFDVTLSPLIRLWGFGPAKNKTTIPGNEDIAAAKVLVGMEKLLVLSENPVTLMKKAPAVTVNLSAIAKGYGVDQVARAVEKHGAKNYLVEIGGDLYSKGLNARGEPWSIGIEKPDATGRTIQKIVKISNLGMATSGDYRNYVEKDGKRYSHIIDPATARPITHNLASVTVLSENGMRADGLATALFVLGEKDGMRIAEKNNIAAFFIVREGNKFVETSSSRFKELTK